MQSHPSRLTTLAWMSMVVACGQVEPRTAPASDASDCMSFASQVDTCTLDLQHDLTLTGVATYDTTTHELIVQGAVQVVAHTSFTGLAGDVEALLARDVQIGSNATLHATGGLPLAIIASGAVTLGAGATVDVSAGGAGARSSCPDAATRAPGASRDSPIGGSVTDVSPGGAGGGGGGMGFVHVVSPAPQLGVTSPAAN
jgi:hypothetical protein